LYNQQHQRMTNDNDFLWRQFIKLGDYMGDGLHHEPDGKWISREYRKLSKILIPEIKEQEKSRRQIKNRHIDEQIKKRIETDNCSKCQGSLKQVRSGSKVVQCVECKAKFQYKSKKKNPS